MAIGDTAWQTIFRWVLIIAAAAIVIWVVLGPIGEIGKNLLSPLF